MKKIQTLSALTALMLVTGFPCMAHAQSTSPTDATSQIDPGAATRPQAPVSRRQVSSESADGMRASEHGKESGKAKKVPAVKTRKDPTDVMPQPLAGAPSK